MPQKVSPEYFIQLCHRVNTLHKKEKKYIIEVQEKGQRKSLLEPKGKGQKEKLQTQVKGQGY